MSNEQFENEKATFCLEQAKYFELRHNRRRDAEWRVSFGLWTLIIVSAHFIPKGYIKPWMLIVLFVVYSIFWLRGLWIANQNDKEQEKYFWDLSSKLLFGECVDSIKSNLPPRTEFWHLKNMNFIKDWSILFQLLTTIVLFYFSYLISLPPN